MAKSKKIDSNSVSGDADETLKLLSSFALREMGYVTELAIPLDVDVYSMAYKHDQATDVDVFAYQFAPDFHRDTLVVECKSGEGKAVEELLKLSAVAQLFTASRGWLVKTRIAGNARSLAPTLNVKPFDETEILGLVESSGNDPKLVLDQERLLLRAEFAIREALLDKKETQRLIKYCDADVWRRESWQNFHNLLAILAKTSSSLSPDNPVDRALVFRSCRLIGMTILELTSAIVAWSSGTIDRGVEIFLYGGPAERRERERMLDEFRTHAPEKFEQSPLEPPYLGDLKEVVAALIRNAFIVARVPLVLQDAERRLYVAPGVFGDSLADYWDDRELKLAKDLIEFALKASGVSEEFADSFFAI